MLLQLGLEKSSLGWKGWSTGIPQTSSHCILCSPLWLMPKKNKTGNVRIKVTLRRVRVTTAAVEKQQLLFWVRVYCFSYPECKSHASYYIATCVRLYHIFPHPINGTILGEKSYWTQNVCSDLLYNLCLKHFIILTRILRDTVINVQKPTCKVPVILIRF